MSSGSSLETKERVKQAINIVDLVGDYLDLRREGRAYKAICPWHNDTRPSLQVNPERQSFKCWPCDIGGDVFSFVMKMENVTFPEALEMLAERAGIPLEKTSRSGSVRDDKQLLHQAMAWAEDQYHQVLLKSPSAEKARDYLRDRGITDDSIRRFHLGFAPTEWEWLIPQARGTRFTPEVLEAIGLVLRRPNGPGYYDRFRGRVLFSIRDPQSRPVGLGGRILPGAGDDRTAKYVNSPETPIFSKSHLLYGLDFARDAITKGGRTAVVMEGYTDCLIAQQFGIANAVAALGTAFGERHLQLLRRYAERVVLVLDGDEAGRRRTDQLLDLFIAEPVDLRILTLPDNLDPCDFLLARGAEEFSRLLTGAPDALEHRFRSATADVTADSSVHQANRALEEVLATLARSQARDAASQLKEEQILNRLAKKFGISEERVRSRVISLQQSARPRTAPRATAPTAPSTPTLDAWERELLELAIQSVEGLEQIREEISTEQLTSPAARAILTMCYELAGSTTSLFDRLLVEFEEPELKSLLVDLDERGRAKGVSEIPARLAQLMGFWRRKIGEAEQRREATALVDRRGDSSAELQILRQIIERERSRQGISVPTDG